MGRSSLMIYFLVVGIPLIYAKAWLVRKIVDTSSLERDGLRVGCEIGTGR
jgi:hypothetical protein